MHHPDLECDILSKERGEHDTLQTNRDEQEEHEQARRNCDCEKRQKCALPLRQKLVEGHPEHSFSPNKAQATRRRTGT